jgi:hypothetical protein
MEHSERVFEVDGFEYSMDSMIDANKDDEGLCEWLHEAQVGDVFPAFVECKRVA